MVGLWVSLAASVLAFIALVAFAISKVRAGQGLESFRTLWLVESNWLSLLIFVAVAAVAICLGLWFRLREQRELDALGKERHG